MTRLRSDQCLWVVLGLLSALLVFPVLSFSAAAERSDLNVDQLVDDADLKSFSLNFLQAAEQEIDWCQFYQATAAGKQFRGRPTHYYRRHFRLLLTFITDKYLCPFTPYVLLSDGAKGGDDLFSDGFEDRPLSPLLEVKNRHAVAVRIGSTGASDAPLFVSDTRTGSVFVYETGLVLAAELKDLDRPMGVAVDSRGYLLIGNDGRDNVEVYDPVDGNQVAVLGGDPILMPTAITMAPDGRILVTDSRSHLIRVFDASYQPLGIIGRPGSGDGELNFPTDAAVTTRAQDGAMVTELFVADQANRRVQVFDLDGQWLRNINAGGCGSFSCRPPKFVRLQALGFDSLGRLHALDLFEAVVSVIDPATGALLTSYGEFGTGPGQLRVPMDLFIDEEDRVILTTGDRARIEYLVTP
jgi:DNA-binding beta-propeller fold protein YncE